MPPPKRPELALSSNRDTEPLQTLSQNERMSRVRKRRHSTFFFDEDCAVYDEASKENRGFVSAKTFGETVAKKRSLIKEISS